MYKDKLEFNWLKNSRLGAHSPTDWTATSWKSKHCWYDDRDNSCSGVTENNGYLV